MISVWFGYIFLASYCAADVSVPVPVSVSRPSGYMPFHPELLEPMIVPPSDLLRNPDVDYVHHRPAIKDLRNSISVDRIIRNSFVFMIPNRNDNKYSAYFLSKGIDTLSGEKPIVDSLIRNADSDTALVVDPLLRSQLLSLRISNFTVVPDYYPLAIAYSVAVPWITFRNATVTERNNLGEKRIHGRLYNLMVFSDDDWDFFPANSVFDWTRPFPFAFAPPPPPVEETSETSEKIKENSTVQSTQSVPDSSSIDLPMNVDQSSSVDQPHDVEKSPNVSQLDASVDQTMSVVKDESLSVVNQTNQSVSDEIVTVTT